MKDLGIVIPAYNEEDGIAEVLTRVKAACPEAMVLVVDDCSRDKTAAVARSCDVTVIVNSVNCNYGKALNIGFKHLVKENHVKYLSFLDADGTYPPESIPDLYVLCTEYNIDVATGSRFLGSNKGMPLIRKVGNRIFALLLSIYSGKHITDTGTGLRVFKSELLPFFDDLPNDLSYTPAMSSLIAFMDIRYTEIPIEYSRRQGRSKLSSIKDGYRFLKAIMKETERNRPAIFYCTLGIPFLLSQYIVNTYCQIRDKL